MSGLHVVVVGGGVAGVSCAEEVLRVDDDATVTLISGSATIKGVRAAAAGACRTKRFVL